MRSSENMFECSKAKTWKINNKGEEGVGITIREGGGDLDKFSNVN